MFGLFNSKVEPDPYIPAYVLDNGDTFAIDEDYVDLGMREGWLVWEGYVWTNGKAWRMFRHI